MSSTSAITIQAPSAVSITEGRLNPNQLIAQRNAVIDAMQRVMKVDVDFGIIPGTPKPTLYKSGSEKILSMFHLAAEPRVEDLSTPDRIHYRVFVTLTHAPSGVVLGTGIGEASSAESKYQWREVLCDDEWNATPEDRRRTKWKKAYGKIITVNQVRTEHDDVANTILKMAKKRAQIDATLTCTAASDMFSQDIEDLKDAGLDPSVTEEVQKDPLPQTLPPKQSPPAMPPGYNTFSVRNRETQAERQPAQDAQLPAPAQQQQTANHGETISEGEAKMFWAKAIGRTADYKLILDYLKSVQGVQNKAQILKSRLKEALLWAETGRTE